MLPQQTIANLDCDIALKQDEEHFAERWKRISPDNRKASLVDGFRKWVPVFEGQPLGPPSLT